MGCEIAEYVSADEYLLDQTEYDLLFLDIELDGAASSMDGMELARRIRGMELEGPPVIIFVTGYEKYVYDAFDVVILLLVAGGRRLCMERKQVFLWASCLGISFSACSLPLRKMWFSRFMASTLHLSGWCR